MCGIAGIFHFSGELVEPSGVDAMLDEMPYRGPDDRGLFVEGAVCLGHLRLSILDLSADGHQPMYSADGRLVIVFNGEIYNYVELRDELRSEFSFKTNTDTEVLINAYRKWGRSCLHKLNGMFAFAIYDRQTCALWCARDRFGVKPFYYYADARKLVFASEPLPILRAVPEAATPDAHTIYDFLAYNRSHHTRDTFLKDIKKLQHGHELHASRNKLTESRWYDLKSHLRTPFASPAELEHRLHDSIRLRLRSDVPVGACLSGGIDSSSIVSLVATQLGRPDVHAFSAVYGKGLKGDETEFIEEYQGRIPNIRFVRPTADSLYSDLPRFVRALQEPVQSTSAYAEFKLFELAHKWVTVILNGQGSDECFGGYFYLHGYLYKEMIRQGRWIALVREVAQELARHRSSESLQAAVFFMLPSAVKEQLTLQRLPWLARDFTDAHRGRSSFLERLYGANSLHEALLEHFESKFEHNLIWGDRSSMFFSMEARFPFLDYRLVESALSLANDQLLQNGETKVILRRAMASQLPQKILHRQDKIGYDTPEDIWMRTPKWRDYIRELLSSHPVTRLGIFNAARVRGLYEAHYEGSANVGAQIWKIVHLGLWLDEVQAISRVTSPRLSPRPRANPQENAVRA